MSLPSHLNMKYPVCRVLLQISYYLPFHGNNSRWLSMREKCCYQMTFFYDHLYIFHRLRIYLVYFVWIRISAYVHNHIYILFHVIMYYYILHQIVNGMLTFMACPFVTQLNFCKDWITCVVYVCMYVSLGLRRIAKCVLSNIRIRPLICRNKSSLSRSLGGACFTTISFGMNIQFDLFRKAPARPQLIERTVGAKEMSPPSAKRLSLSAYFPHPFDMLR